MKFITTFGLGPLALILCVSAQETSPTQPGDPALRLWYRAPALVWTEALPVGNGHLGAMVFGGMAGERLQFNEDTLWNGSVHQYHRDGAVRALPEIRRLLAQGLQDEAEELAMREFMSVPLRQKMYQAFGDAWLSFPGHDRALDYERSLDLDTAVAAVRYGVGGVTFTRETFSSHPDNVVVEHIRADRPGSVGFSLKLSSLHASSTVKITGDQEMVMTGRVEEGGLRFAAHVRIAVDGGSVAATKDALVVRGANAATVYISAATSFRTFQDISGDPADESARTLQAAAGKDYQALREAHVADHRRLFRRVTLDLGTSAAAALPTDERLAA
ncbi:MAG TPA: glycoside hydrolase family 95 protein, partial [Opitutaceae bacterium]